MDLDTNNNSNSKLENNNQQTLLSLLNNTKKENQFLFEKILGYKTQIKKILAGSRILFEKHKICLEENEKLKSKNRNILSKEKVINFEIKGKIQNKKLKSCASYNNIHINTESNNRINNEKQVILLANNLIKLVVDINSTLFKYDFNLIKISKNNKLRLNDIFEINRNIDINFLLQEKNFKLFSKYISCNLDIINNKIINLPNILFLNNNNNKHNKDNKNSSMTMKNSSELSKNSNINRINQSLNFYSPGNKNGSKTMKNYINLKKTRNNIRNQKLVRNATSRDRLTYMNFYNNNDLESIPSFKKNISLKTTNRLFNQTVNLEKERKSKTKF